MHPEVTNYIAKAPEEQRRIMEAVRQLIHAAVPGVNEEFKWSRPVYRSTKDFAYLKSAKAYVSFGFMEAGKLHDPDGRLEGTGKDMRHIKLRTLADVDEKLLKGWLKALVEAA